MKKSWIIWGAVAVVLLVVAMNGCSSYNSFITESENVDNAWAKVQTQYQRRADLLPSLFEVVGRYAKHEKETYESVTKARAGLDDAVSKAKAT